MPSKRSSDVHRRKIQKEIQKQQNRLAPTIPNQSFKRVVQEIMQNNHGNAMNFRSEAIDALQVAAEEMLTELFRSSKEIAEYTGRDTVTHNDMRFSIHHQQAGRGATGEFERTALPQAIGNPTESP